MYEKKYLAMLLATTVLCGSTMAVSADETTYSGESATVAVDSNFNSLATDLSGLIISIPYGKTMQYVDTDVAKLPFKLTNLDKFIESRTVIIDRYDLKHKLAEVGINDKLDLISLTHGVSLADTFWVKEENSRYQWSDVSPYQSARQFDISWFFENMSNKQAYIGLPDYSTDGNFPKCWVNVENKKYLVKCGTSGA